MFSITLINEMHRHKIKIQAIVNSSDKSWYLNIYYGSSNPTLEGIHSNIRKVVRRFIMIPIHTKRG